MHITYKMIIFAPENIKKETNMAKENVEKLLEAGGADESLRMKYNAFYTKEEFVEQAAKDGYEFTVEELTQVLNEAGDSFDSYGNPPKRTIWWT